MIRRMTRDDIPDGMRLKNIAGWNQKEHDWELFLEANPDGCFVYMCEDSIVGTIATIRYEDRFAWIGMMLVDPSFRRRGIATSLMNHALEYLGHDSTVKLDATPVGKTVYNRLGFKVEYVISRMIAHFPAIEGEIIDDLLLLPLNDLSEIVSFDSTAFGANRQRVLRSLINNRPELSWRRLHNGKISGYCTGRPGTNFWQIGPVIARKSDDAVSLTAAAVRSIHGQPVVIDVPVRHKSFLRTLQSMGFSEQRQLIRMFHGANEYPGNPDLVYAITGPELG